jgi:hypothetical protein
MEQVTQFSRALFDAHVGEEFELVGDDGLRVPTLLQRVADRGGAPHATLFSLYFLVPPEGPKEQGLFRLERPGLGAVDLLLVPVRQEGESILFEAAFSLLGPEGA